ncbi:hypothetical protein IE81DRAFT_339548 [Ceraceosorus guamensis]|uniref:P-loop containing nucleoside triphosphate hydrolase protein n=1 Tax=Ceraceosorus guamensis TaxID=1522189 RepID=A0A316W5W2_9BASI|nr:hypothetical protein IE81DRAFT_339548 [Ceraceosorus guamensis]PWN45267.1 hypothetical protein IE81DRAFT_339548 [Ceraceosorus guamensis]
MLGPAVRTASGPSRGLQAALSCASPYLVANSACASHRQGKHCRTTTPAFCTPNRPRSTSLPPLGARFSSSSATPPRSRAISSKDALASIASDQGPIPTPKQLMAHLDAYVIGQATAKRTLCVAVHNHLLRCRIEDAQSWEEQRKGEISEEEGTDNVPGSASKEVKRQIPFANRGLTTGASGYRNRPRKSRSLHPDSLHQAQEHETGPGSRYEEDILTDWAGQAKGRRYVDGYAQDDAGDGRPEAHASGSSQKFFNSNLSESDMRAQRQLEWTRTPADPAPHSASRADSSTSGSSHARNRGPARTTSSLGIVSSADDKPRLPRPNVLLLGPSGSGKTLLLSTLARALRLPFVHVDATPLTQAGYVGEDAENIVARLLSAAGGDVQAAQRGIVVLDEVDKLARRPGDSASKDVSGEGVQQSLLRILEGAIISVPEKAAAGNAAQAAAASAPGSAKAGRQTQQPWWPPGREAEKRQEGPRLVDTSGILFVLSGAFIGLDDVIKRRLRGVAAASAVEGREVDQSRRAAAAAASRRASDLYDLAEVEDLTAYGLIPEFIGRVPVMAALSALSEEELLRVMTEPRHSLTQEYETLFRAYGVELRFTSLALQVFASQAVSRRTGARALRRMVETTLLDAQFTAPGSSIKYALVDCAAARGDSDVQLFSRGAKSMFERAWEEEKGSAQKKGKASCAGKPFKKDGQSASSNRSQAQGSLDWGQGMGIPPEVRRARQAAMSSARPGARSTSASSSAARHSGSNGGVKSGARKTLRSDETTLRRAIRTRLSRPSRVGNLRIIAE